ncbi:MAG TPA: hypothetical protein VM428_10325, partial [Microlunatus sp.]|nr:hypothetical protein [Microlunatus sp.]
MPDPSSSTQTATDALAEEFGANDWLLEEMYEQYVSDPGSVDPTWAEYFKTHQLGGATNRSTGNGPTANGSTGPAAKPAAPAAAPKAAAAPAKQTAPPAPAPS